MGRGENDGTVWERPGARNIGLHCAFRSTQPSSMETPWIRNILHECMLCPVRVPLNVSPFSPPPLFHLSDACCFGIAKDPMGMALRPLDGVLGPRSTRASICRGGGAADWRAPLHKNEHRLERCSGGTYQGPGLVGTGQSGGPAPRAHALGTNTHIAAQSVWLLPSCRTSSLAHRGLDPENCVRRKQGGGLVGRGIDRDSGLAWPRQGWFLLNDPSESEHSISQMGRRHVPSSYVTLQRRKGASS